jgi:hypothetical protein
MQLSRLALGYNVGRHSAEFSGGVAVDLDGSSYLTGTSDSFAVDEFNLN